MTASLNVVPFLKIHRATPLAVQWRKSRAAITTTQAQETKETILHREATTKETAVSSRTQVVVLRGDALVTAHYRLGVGVNAALSAVSEIGILVRYVCCVAL